MPEQVTDVIGRKGFDRQHLAGSTQHSSQRSLDRIPGKRLGLLAACLLQMKPLIHEPLQAGLVENIVG